MNQNQVKLHAPLPGFSDDTSGVVPTDDIPTIGIYMHKLQEFHKMQLAAIEKYTEKPYNLLIVNEPGTVHENINKVIDRCTTRYLVILDDDCIVTHHKWLEYILACLKTDKRVGCVCAFEVKNLRTLRKYRQDPLRFIPATAKMSIRIPWVPGYMMAFDMLRTPGIRADEKIPFAKGMSDLDIGLQVQSRGLENVVCSNVIVYHPYKGPVTNQQNYEFEYQKEYMLQKWGEAYTAVTKKYVGALLNWGNTWEEDPEDLKHRPDAGNPEDIFVP